MSKAAKKTETKNEVRSFNHTRKGTLIGKIVEDDGGEWVTIELTETFEPKFLSITRGGYNSDYEPGEKITLRKTLISDF